MGKMEDSFSYCALRKRAASGRAHRKLVAGELPAGDPRRADEPPRRDGGDGGLELVVLRVRPAGGDGADDAEAMRQVVLDGRAADGGLGGRLARGRGAGRGIARGRGGNRAEALAEVENATLGFL